MTIAVINPNASVAMTELIERECQALTGLRQALVFHRCEQSPPSIEGHSDGAQAAYWLAEKIRACEAMDEPPRAYVIACFDDTGLDAARELTRAPVLGIGESAMQAASLLGHRFTVLTSLERSIPILTRNLRHYGYGERCAGVYASNVSVLALEADPASYDLVLERAWLALEQSRGEMLVLGCAGMSHWVARLQKDVGVPVIDGVRIAVVVADALASLGLQTSKSLGYAFPETKAVPETK